MSKILKAAQMIIAPELAKIETQIEHLQGDFDESNQRIVSLTERYIELGERMANLEGKLDSAVEIVEAKVVAQMARRQQGDPPQLPLPEE